MDIGFVGLGTMGRGMARNLLASGAPLVVFDQKPDAVQNLVAEGATGARTVAELAAAADVVFLSLPGPVQVEEVVLGSSGILANMRPGLVLIDLSTGSPALAHRIDGDLRARGGALLDAPISGGPAGAATGTLSLWVGGDRDVYERHLDLLHVIGDEARHVGAVGAGTVTKLAHNMLGYMVMECLAEVFSMAVKAGVEPLELWEALRMGMAGKGSPLDMLVNQFLPGTYEPPAFAMRLAHKDVTLATALGRELGVPMRLAGLTHQEMTEALNRGFGDQDSRAYLKLQLERSGVKIAVDPERLAAAVAAVRSRTR